MTDDTIAPLKPSLREFLSAVESMADWRSDVAGLLATMPSHDDAIREMMWLTKPERDALRSKLGYFLAGLGEYITHTTAEMEAVKADIAQSDAAARAFHHYQSSQALSPTTSA